jgi:phosphate starvation-inducible membrane PsiE
MIEESNVLGIRVAIGVLMLLASWELWKLAIATKSQLFYAMVRGAFYVFLFFAFARIVAALVDSYVLPDAYAVASTSTAVIFWLTAWLFFYRHRKAFEETPSIEQQKVTQSLDTAIEGLHRIKRRVDKTVRNA